MQLDAKVEHDKETNRFYGEVLADGKSVFLSGPWLTRHGAELAVFEYVRWRKEIEQRAADLPGVLARHLGCEPGPVPAADVELIQTAVSEYVNDMGQLRQEGDAVEPAAQEEPSRPVSPGVRLHVLLDCWLPAVVTRRCDLVEGDFNFAVDVFRGGGHVQAGVRFRDHEEGTRWRRCNGACCAAEAVRS